MLKAMLSLMLHVMIMIIIIIIIIIPINQLKVVNRNDEVKMMDQKHRDIEKKLL